MKQMIAAWLRYSRAERIGIGVLSLLLTLLLIIRCAMHCWVHPPGQSLHDERRLLAAYEAWQARESAARTARAGIGEAQVATSLFYFDPNTLDSEGFLRLGMTPRVVRGLMNWRRKGKHFYKPEDLKPLYNLPPETYARLAPFISIAGTSEHGGNFYATVPAPEFIDLNTADSATLDRFVPGIGAVLAHKIVARRQALGGFLRHEQLLEVYRFPDSTFQKLKQQLRIDPASVRKLDISTATVSQLTAHPYIGEKLAGNIVLYREGIGGYQQVEQLRQVPLMNEEIYRKIAPYLTVGNYVQSGSGSGTGKRLATGK